MVWHKNRNTDQWNTVKSPEINLCKYGQLIYDKGAKNAHEERIVPSNTGIWKTDSLMQNNNWTPVLHHHRNNSKWVKDLKVRPKTIKLLEDIAGKSLDI